MDTEDSAYALHTIMGDDPVNLMYTDSWGAVIKACEARGLLVELSQPGMPQTNAKAERCNQDVLDGLRA
eukprot:3869516-Lingulodinium_polyedra.AAC.1